MSIPYRIGRPTPDGGLQLNEAEREWLGELLKRVDTAYSETAFPTHRPPPEGYVTHYTARALAEVIAPFAAVEDVEQTQEDEMLGYQKKRAEITIIKGGVPPRPAF